MATTKEFHDYVMELLQSIGSFSSRKMMGEYCIYWKGKTVALLCDNVLLLKPTPSVLQLLPCAERTYPYEGSKTRMVVIEDLENTELLEEAFSAMYDELPEPKKKPKSGKIREID